TRIKLLSLLVAEDELCVCDIADALHMQQSAISHQLRVLRNARLVKFRKDGKEAFYSLDDDHVIKLMEQGLEHILHG
ncbi:MAG: metalloregulator ArsR/SmtB family transcription factor, partial [Selenomonadaceae bacterium]|nr:metalloregulator ArsR/SmtB family transcription factor [Selenomonadaceae bacterium]